MSRLLFLFTLFTGILAFSFMNVQAPEYKMVYVDQNNNTYYVNEKKIKYVPVSPKESSSGVYSGGKPWEKEIDNEVYFVIETAFKEAIANKKNHLKTRIKPSVMLKTFKSTKEKVYILKPDSALHATLQNLEVLKTKMD